MLRIQPHRPQGFHRAHLRHEKPAHLLVLRKCGQNHPPFLFMAEPLKGVSKLVEMRKGKSDLGPPTPTPADP